MPDAPAGPDTIRILIATDNHVGYNERDAERGDDSANTFDEVMRLAKEKTVDMVLLAGDLFHENSPSRKSLNAVMRSLRMNCYGDKPCELEMISDPTEHFDSMFDHVNYEDPDINVAIPVFSIHGNHDDPSGAGHLAALDLLQTCGLINYYGRTPESDNINVKPVLLQKGRSKLALYGLSNVRDERLHRTWRDNQVRFFRPNAQKDNWFNLMSIHQNHVQHTSTGTDWIPEEFLPDFMDLVVWGHEHECLIEPRWNPERNFRVMQPGSSVATSLMPGEAVEKHVAVVEVTGKEFKTTPVRLKTVRPFVMRDIVLRDEPGMAALAHKENNRAAITRHLEGIVNELISQARQQWHDAQEEVDDDHDESEVPKPLIRIRVDYTAPDGGRFDMENPQRFSNRFVGRVANKNDVVQFHKKKAATRNAKGEIDLPEESTIAQLTLDTVKVEKLVREYLTAQTLQILPQNLFGDAVSQFVDKDDKHAMDMFVTENLGKQVTALLKEQGLEDDDIMDRFGKNRSNLENLFMKGHLKNSKKARLKPKPDHWDSDLDGAWEDQPGAIMISEGEADDGEDSGAEDGSVPPTKGGATRGRGKASGTAARKGASASQRAAPKGRGGIARSGARGKAKVIEEDDEDEDDDVIMIDDDDDDNDIVDEPAPAPARKTANGTAKPAAKRAAPATKKTPARSTKASPAASKQTQLSFQQPATQKGHTNGRTQARHQLSDDEISDDEDAFESTPATVRPRVRR